VVIASGRVVAVLLVLLVALGLAGVPVSRAADPQPDVGSGAVGATPPRLAFVDGQVSFWRPGAEEWVEARVNTALAPGDELYTGAPGNVELQIGARAYVRAWGRTQLGLVGQEPDFVQVKVTAGYVSLDLRRLEPGHTVELDTPDAAFTIERAGYYRVNVVEGRTSFITRRGGRATVTTARGAAATLAPSEEVIVEGPDGVRVSTYVAPELDAWDRWNYARTEALLDSLSSRYVAEGVYGIDDLDHHGSWRVVETYGPVWVPTGVPAGWVPYGSGSWTWDPHYGWTWVDVAPWGWAPYHYGRWVHVGGVWGWAPGPLVVRPVYAPALVAFLGPRVGITVGVAGPAIGWVALGWGEPIIPWWGPVGFIGAPRWVGWGGPRVVNNVVVTRTTVVHVHDIRAYRHAAERDAVVAVPRDRFGRGPVPAARVTVRPGDLEPLRGRPDVAPARASLVPAAARGARPPEEALRRPIVATRAPGDPAQWLRPHGLPAPPGTPAAAPRLVTAPPRTVERPERPPFGPSTIERRPPVAPPRPERSAPSSPGARAATPAPPAATAPKATVPPSPRGQAPPSPGTATMPGPPAPTPRVQQPRSPASGLPGEPANRVFPGRAAPAPRVGPPEGHLPDGRPGASESGPGAPARPGR
jgi:hypothetical protein